MSQTLVITRGSKANFQVVTEDGRVIVSKLRLAQTHWEKFRGLMLDSSLQPDEALLIRRCNSIHCCFMKIDIDVLFIDGEGRILHMIPRMRPWTFSPLVRKARDVIECYAGTIDRYDLHVGDIVNIVKISAD